ncbi:FAD-dependent oxidoreductase [Ihubacter massiliensis]|uniref:FAD-dependent oxidoreductase n=1 Tax=Hominibacterium faecale TaxID=2839743 RepID=A0A9J6QMM8_9FIRM|nr:MULTISPECIES: FAD-dependent oxidoreductase [Eubacteriales Family XIII. Incertae Sedis]MCO7122904.1 FAD-dependent oxidoreductase [Ihubacter massiliensis]MCU7377178.1 FAD-dependent oxidoreductase [Hominibacterium faecale]
MNKQFPHVLAPVRIGGQLLKNRIFVAPITPHSASNGEPYPNEEIMTYFEDRAKTGAAVVYCGGTKAADVFDDGEHCAWDTSAFNHKNALTLLAARIKSHGARPGMEIMGLLPASWRPGPPLGCSDGNRVFQSQPITQEITKEEMERFKEATAQMCENLMECGYEQFLFHFGHSIPLAQFLSPLTNRRTDEYGGSTENRCRYLVEILDACREATKGKVIFEIRMSATEFEEGGIDLEEGIRIASIFQEHCDIIQASCGMVTEKYMTVTHPCQHMGPHPNLWLAEAFKKSGKIHKPVTAIGAFESLQAAEDAIAAGKCDFVAVCRQFIADPETIHKAVENRADDVVPCIKCMRCHDSDCYEHLFRCAVNPLIGFDSIHQQMFPAAAKKQKKVAVIGGGPAGMKAAITAFDRGHKVTLYEKADKLGGALGFSEYVEFKYALCSYKNYLIHQVGKRAIDVKLKTEAAPEMLNDLYDAVIIAVGAEPVMLPIPGYNTDNGMVATDAYCSEDKLGKTVVIIGGGQVGCETALYLADKGLDVSVIEIQKSLCPDASKSCGDEIRILLDENPNFTAICGAKCIKMTKNSVTYIDAAGKECTAKCDTVILAAGMKARTALADSFITDCDVPEWAQAGDCISARTVEQATAEAYNAAMAL